jgi:3-hydroxyisobutyrate dehydrogenase-like beta-hydroxyacid dehydrogenase
MSEAFAFGARQNVAPEKLAEIFTGTLFAAPAYKTYSAAILEQKFEAGFKLALGLKDVRLMLAAGEKAGAPLPFASVVRDNFVDALAHGEGDKDWAAISRVAYRRAALATE